MTTLRRLAATALVAAALVAGAGAATTPAHAADTSWGYRIHVK